MAEILFEGVSMKGLFFRMLLFVMVLNVYFITYNKTEINQQPSAKSIDLAECGECLIAGKLNEKTLCKNFKCLSCDSQKNLICQLSNYLFSDSLDAKQRFTVAHALQKLFQYKRKTTRALTELHECDEHLQVLTFIIAHLYPHPLYAALEHGKIDIVQKIVKNYPICLSAPITLPSREKSMCGTMLDHLQTILAKEKDQIHYLSPVSVRDEFEIKKYQEMKERVTSLEKLLHTLRASGAQSLQDFSTSKKANPDKRNRP